MSRRDIQTEFRLAAARGIIKQENVNRYTLTTILEAAVQAFHHGFYGATLETELGNVRRMNHEARERALKIAEGKINDLSAIRRMHQETHTTSDFPLALAQARDFTRRQAYLPPDSEIMMFANKRTANDFKTLRGIRANGIDRLARRPEGTNVTYASFGSTTDGYQVANFELAVAYTWEAWVNDDIGEFVGGMEALGNAARRNRSMVIWDAIVADVARQQLAGSNGGPDIEHLQALMNAFAAKTVTLADGQTKPRPSLLTDIVVPVGWRSEALMSLNSTQVIVNTGGTKAAPIAQANPVQGAATPHVETMLTESFTDYPLDWLGIDNRTRPIEFATLKGYEGGPKTFTKLPDVIETDLEGSFENHTIAVKVSDNIGAKVTEPNQIIRVQGQ